MIKLGSIVIILLIWSVTNLFAGVSAKFQPNAAVAGDRVDFIITSDSENTQFPDLEKIGGVPVEAVSGSQNMTSINGKREVVISRRYTIFPRKDVTADPAKVIVNGKTLKTNRAVLKVNPPSKTKSSPFSFDIKSSKKSLYVGEELVLELVFNVDANIQLTGLHFDEAGLKDFIFKAMDKQWIGQQNGSKNRFTRRFRVIPQRAGKIKIDEQQIVAQTRNGNSLFANNINKRVYSNSLELNIKPIPKDLFIVGDFTIGATIDKMEVKSGNPVTVTITTQGYGSLDGYEPGLPKIEGVTVFKDKTDGSDVVRDGKLYATKTVKAAFLANKDFTVPKFRLEYFDPKAGKRRVKETKEFAVTVKGKPLAAKEKENMGPVVIQASKEREEQPAAAEKESDGKMWLYITTGFIAGLITAWLAATIRRKKEGEKRGGLFFKGLKPSSKKDLYRRVLPFSGDKEADRLIAELEKELYKDKSSTISLRELRRSIKRLEEGATKDL